MSQLSRRAFLLAAPGVALLARAPGSRPAFTPSFTQGGFIPESAHGVLIRIGQGDGGEHIVPVPGTDWEPLKRACWRLARVSDDSQWDPALGAWMDEREGNA